MAADTAAPALPATMKAWAYSSFKGGADALKLEDVPVPVAKEAEVLVKVKVCGLNGLDWKLQEGMLRPVFPAKLPFVSGFDIAGTVVAVGSKVADFKAGDEVFGAIAFVGGAFAEYMAIPAANVAKRPDSLAPKDAVSLAVAGIAAIQSLRDGGGLNLGPKAGGTETSGPAPNVMIANGTGAVGLTAIQLAKLAGAHVSTTCGARNIEFVKKLGADEAVDYRSPEGAKLASPSGVKYDIIVDGAPNMTWKVAGPAMTPAGKWLCLSPSPAMFLNSLLPFFTFSKQRLLLMSTTTNTKDLEILAKLVTDGALKVDIDSEFPFSQLPEAWKKCRKGPVLGKIVVNLE